VLLLVLTDEDPAVPPGVVEAEALAAPFLEVADAPVGDDVALDPPAVLAGGAPVFSDVCVSVFVVTLGGTTTVADGFGG